MKMLKPIQQLLRVGILVGMMGMGFHAFAQHENQNWYFGNGTDGIIFINNIPSQVSNKYPGVGFEGIVVVSDPFTGNLLFYSDGTNVIDKNHVLMTNGTGLSGHYSGAQSVQCCPVPGSCMKQYYLFTNSAYDNASGLISYSVIDFTTNPLGVVTNKNTLLWAGASDEGMCLINKSNSNDYWLITNNFATASYYVWQISLAGISAPVNYVFSNSGSSYQINYSEAAQKIVVTGWGNKHVTTIDFNAATGVLSNEFQCAPPVFGNCYGARFSPDGSQLYVGVNPPTYNLMQYNMNTGGWSVINTCCYAHDVKMGPDGKMYFIHTYNASQPIGVIDYPDSSAVGNSCNYHTLSFPAAFNGQVRRFPEFLSLPHPPVALADTLVVNATLPVSLNVMINDTDLQGDSLLLDSILQAPGFGISLISGSQIIYTADTGYCGMTDTIIYMIKDVNCSYDTATVLIHIECNQVIAGLASTDTSFCEKKCIDFYDLSTNNPTSWQWFFPGADSSTSSLQNPTNICYNQYGSFDVTLITCNAGGCDTLIYYDFINEYPAPVPVITQSNDTLFSSPGFAYQWWSVSGGIIAGANNYYYIPTQGGSYYVIVTDSVGCEGASNTIIITSVIEWSVGSGQLSVIPNPNNGAFTITLNTSVNKDFALSIINSLGQIIYTENGWRGRQPGTSLSVDVKIENVVHGFYSAEVINGDKIYHARFIVE